MILIADSGSTKADWILVDNTGKPVRDFKTTGFNPFFHDVNFVEFHLRDCDELNGYSPEVEYVFFYGAGCSSDELNAIIKKGLKSVFINAKIHVDHDLVGAAYACYNGDPNIACIIGTGSNSCFFDGKKATEEVPALAYILGDEASGSYFGKHLIAQFLYKKLPADLAADFNRTYKLSKAQIFENVYNKPHANVYLASFMKFYSNHKEHPFIQETVYNGMYKFLETHVCCFDNHKNIPVNFVGSVAYHFDDILKKAANDLGISIRSIIKKPINGLVNYHFKYKKVLKK